MAYRGNPDIDAFEPIMDQGLLPAPNIHGLLVNQFSAQHFWVNTLPRFPGDRFYCFPQLEIDLAHLFFGGAVIIDGSLFFVTGSMTTLTYMFPFVEDPVSIVQFLQCLHTYNGVIRIGAFIINDMPYICNWSIEAINMLESLIINLELDEISIDLAYNREYFNFWQNVRRNLFIYSSNDWIEAADMLRQQYELLEDVNERAMDFVAGEMQRGIEY